VEVEAAYCAVVGGSGVGTVFAEVRIRAAEKQIPPLRCGMTIRKTKAS